MSRKLEPELRQRLLRDPDAPVRLIVGVSGNLDARAEALSRRGVTVRRRLSLIGAVAVGATGRQALAVSREPWVQWIEEDREVRAFTLQDGRSR